MTVDIETIPNHKLCDACRSRKRQARELRRELAELERTVQECASANDGEGWRS